MAKSKSFLDMADVESPVTQFISVVTPTEEVPSVPKSGGRAPEKVYDTESTLRDTSIGQSIVSDAALVRSLSGRTYKNAELKTRRVQLLLKQSVYEKLVRVSDNIGVSVNELIHMLVENYPEK